MRDMSAYITAPTLLTCLFCVRKTIGISVDIVSLQIN